MKRKRLLELEILEDRLTPSNTGVAWPDPGHLTLSFVPDGTAVGQSQSNLFSKLDQVAPLTTWQNAILKAFQTWEIQADLNIRVVPDLGQPLGTKGAPQADSRFGDIRIAAAPLPDNAVSTANPFQWTGTTWGGDVVINSNYNFGIGTQGAYDLYTVMLHEAGHAIGMEDNTTDPASAMYAYYKGVRSGVDAQDIHDIQSLYGAPGSHTSTLLYLPILTGLTGLLQDVGGLLGLFQNNSFQSATPLSTNQTSLLGITLSDMRFTSAAELSINNSSDVDFYKIQCPSASAFNGQPISMVAMMWGMDSNPLYPKINVFDANQRPVAAQVLGNDHGVFSLQISGVTAGAYYYIKVGAQTPGAANSTGNYYLGISLHSEPPISLNTTASDKLSASKMSSSGSFTVNENQLFHFVLTAAVTGSSSVADVTMNITDQSGNILLNVTATSGQPPMSAVIFLGAGTYNVSFTARLRSGWQMPTVAFWLQSEILSDPIGPYYTSSPNNSSSTGYSTTTTNNGSTPPYYY